MLTKYLYMFVCNDAIVNIILIMYNEYIDCAQMLIHLQCIITYFVLFHPHLLGKIENLKYL